eukprot:5790329-Pleurochrysis_carterae.AAC.2
MIRGIDTEQPLKGRARSKSVARTDSLNHTRLGQACPYKSDSLLPGTTKATVQAGEKRRKY